MVRHFKLSPSDPAKSVIAFATGNKGQSSQQGLAFYFIFMLNHVFGVLQQRQ